MTQVKAAVILTLGSLLLSFSPLGFAQWEPPGAADEIERQERLNQAETPEDLMDNMTPEELAEELGVPSGDEFQNWLEMQPDLLFTPMSNAMVHISVDISSQMIHVAYPEGEFSSRISSGRKGYPTKRGCYTPYLVKRMHYSRKYDNSPMPNSIFYYGGYAIHATNEEYKLGRPASHGCVRVSHATSKKIFKVVTSYGRANTRVCVN